MDHCLLTSYLWSSTLCNPLQAISSVSDSLTKDSTKSFLDVVGGLHNNGAFLFEIFTTLVSFLFILILIGVGYVFIKRKMTKTPTSEHGENKGKNANETIDTTSMKKSSRIIVASGAIIAAAIALWKSGTLNKLLGQKLKDLENATDTTIEPEADQSETRPEEVTQAETEPERKILELHEVDPKGKCFTSEQDDWFVVGASVQGNGHLEGDVPCQDSHAYEYISDEWGIAVTSDGAGSAKYSHIGSVITASRAIVHFKELIQEQKWIEEKKLPEDNEWISLSYKSLRKVYEDLLAFARKNRLEIKDLSATVIVVIHSPFGLLTCHIGDGRAGYRDMAGNWHTLLIPHKGEEANQTIFLPSGFWDTPFYTMSGVFVPEARVIREKVSAFTLMSDGCENTAWLCHTLNPDTNKYYDRNIPYDKFFEPVIQTLLGIQDDEEAKTQCADTWYNFIKDGNPSFVKETDDKTIVIGILKNIDKA